MNNTQFAFKDTSEFGQASTSMGGHWEYGYSAQWSRQRVHALAYAIVRMKTWQIPSQEKQRWEWSTNVCASKMDVLRYCSRGFNYEHFWSAGHLPQSWLLSLWDVSTPFLKGQALEASPGYTFSTEDTKERKHCRADAPRINGAACFHSPVSLPLSRREVKYICDRKPPLATGWHHKQQITTWLQSQRRGWSGKKRL